jgi:hypothetical protein
VKSRDELQAEYDLALARMATQRQVCGVCDRAAKEAQKELTRLERAYDGAKQALHDAQTKRRPAVNGHVNGAQGGDAA